MKQLSDAEWEAVKKLEGAARAAVPACRRMQAATASEDEYEDMGFSADNLDSAVRDFELAQVRARKVGA